MELPSEPVMFCKAVTALNGPNDTVIMPKGSKKSDWEVELAVVMGRKAQYVEEANALDYVAGYAVMNDVSERELQLEHGGQWIKGKSFDTSAPLGPWLVTRDEVSDPQNLNLWLEVNGERRQTGNTSTMIFGVAHLISYVSRVMTLLPGDVITTGTPPGVGLGYNPPIFLRDGDVMRLGVEGLGEQRQEVEAWSAPRLTGSSDVFLINRRPFTGAGFLPAALRRKSQDLAPPSSLSRKVIISSTLTNFLRGMPSLAAAISASSM